MSGSQPENKRLPDAAACAVLVIDMQIDFASPDGAMAAYGFDVSDVGGVVTPIRALLHEARRHGVPVVHMRMVNDVRLNAPSWTAFWGQPTVTVPGTRGAEFLPELQPESGELVIDKHSYGAFFGTNLDTILQALGRRVVIVVGTGPNICAGDTLHEAFTRGYRVVAVEDALASFSNRGKAFNRQLKESGLYIIQNHYGLVCRSCDLISHWERCA
jgi:ureidoacrylate peracid hydrolase